VPSHWAILRRTRLRIDDSLEVVAAHGLGGLTGALLTGVFARAAWGGHDGLLFGGPMLVARQLAAIAAALIFSFLMSGLLLRLVMLVVPLRASENDERVGLDVPLHGEEAYTTGEGAILVLRPANPKGAVAAATTPVRVAEASGVSRA
jgi:Amt family ammonium transporter